MDKRDYKFRQIVTANDVNFEVRKIYFDSKRMENIFFATTLFLNIVFDSPLSRAMIDTVNEICGIKKQRKKKKKKRMVVFLFNFLFNSSCEISGKMNVTHEQR